MTTSVMTASAEEILAATAHELRLPLIHINGFWVQGWIGQARRSSPPERPPNAASRTDRTPHQQDDSEAFSEM